MVLQFWKQIEMDELHEVQMMMDWIDKKKIFHHQSKKMWLSILHAVLSISHKKVG